MVRIADKEDLMIVPVDVFLALLACFPKECLMPDFLIFCPVGGLDPRENFLLSSA